MKSLRSRLILISMVMLAAAAAGCVAERVHDQGITAFEHGEYEEGLTKLQQAAQKDPGNLAYRLDLRSHQESAVQKLIAAADDARANGRPEVAEMSYRRVLVLEPGNDRARNGLEHLRADRLHTERIARAEAELTGKQLDAAEGDVRAVLAEDPGFAPALALATRIEQARGPVTLVPRLQSRDARPVTLQFRDAPTKMVFEVLARQTGVNFIFDKDVKSDGKTTIFVSQVPVEDAIDLILTQNQLARQILADNMVLIYPNTSAKQKDYQDQIVHTFYLANAAPKDAESMLKTVLDAKTLYIDDRSSSITLRDTPEHVRMAEKLIASMDEPEPEVIMEVEVLEISHTLADQLGINYPTNVAFAPTPVAAAAAGNAAAGLVLADLGRQNSNTITVSSLSASVDLLKTVGDSNVLSSPRIRAKNKEKAKILVGDRVPVITSGTSATTGGSYSTSSVQYLDVGLTLEVQPTIHGDGNVEIKMALEVSSITKTLNVPIGNGGTTLAYEIGTRNANTLLELKDGETQVLAGLIQDSDTRTSNHIPGLGDLPVLGRLFGSNGTSRSKSEIVLSITPRVIRAPRRPPSDMTEFWYGTESQTRSVPFAGQSPVTTRDAASATPVAEHTQPVAGGVTQSVGGTDSVLPVTNSSGPRPVPALITSSAAAPAAVTAADAAVNGPSGPSAGSDQKPAAAEKAKHADSKPAVTLEGPSTAKVGDEVSIAVRLTSGEPLGRVHAQVRFDATAFQLLGAEPGDLAPAGETPKVDLRPGGAQLDLVTGADAPIAGGGSVIKLRLKAVAERAASTIASQVTLVGQDGVAIAATAATPLQIAISP